MTDGWFDVEAPPDLGPNDVRLGDAARLMDGPVAESLERFCEIQNKTEPKVMYLPT